MNNLSLDKSETFLSYILLLAIGFNKILGKVSNS